MTTGANALLAWFRQPWAKIQTTTDRATNASPRQYRIRARRTCYQCRQEGHHARECPHATTPKPIETKMKRMQALLQSMTPTERAQFKREISPQMTTMQAHLRTMTTLELREFQKQITPNATQIFVTALRNAKTATNPLSRETGPHPTKSLKKLAQALKKRAQYEAERRTQTFHPDKSRKILAEAMKHSTKTLRPEPSTKTLANALTRYTERKSEQPTRTYT